MLILGFDPGMEKCGYGLLEVMRGKPRYHSSGSIIPSPTQSLDRKLAALQENVYSILDEYRADSCGVEDLFAGPNARAALRLGMVHGTILAALGARRLPAYLYSPAIIKKTIAGNGRAAKAAINRMVQRQLGITGSFSPDSSDALAVALCHFYIKREDFRSIKQQ